VLRPIEGVFKSSDYPDLLVGMDLPDDAAVWRLDEGRALVLTTDFFTPVVDDAYDYGAIAAANSLSDVYAMGGQPFLALNIAALPPSLPSALLAEIIRGGAEKAREAGVVIAGGHTIQDQEPKYGLVVIGFVDPHKMLTKRGARVGDRLVLTKPLGFGVTTTALKREIVAPEDLLEAVGWMKKLNRSASRLAVESDLHGGTDITGYSLMGHGSEVAQASGVRLRFSYEKIPFIRGARRYAEAGAFPGGAWDNQAFYGSSVHFKTNLDEADRMLLFDPQTSGGLLLAVAPEKMAALFELAAKLDQPVWEIGQVEVGAGIEIV
jgi:selenide, water dikinase